MRGEGYIFVFETGLTLKDMGVENEKDWIKLLIDLKNGVYGQHM